RDRRGGAGLELKRGRRPASNHLRIEAKPPWRGIARTDRIGRPHRKTVDARTIERRDIDRRDHVGGEHAAERLGEACGFAGQGRKIELAFEAASRLSGGNHFEKLFLSCGGAHRGEQISCPGRRCRIDCHGQDFMMTKASAGRASLAGGRRNEPWARASACSDKYPEASGTTASFSRRMTITSARPTVDVILRAKIAGHAASGSSTLRPVSSAST